MRTIATATVAILLLAGCARQPKLDVSGEWYFLGGGGRLSLVQDGMELSGTGRFPLDWRPTEDSPSSLPVTAHGKVQGNRILLTLEIGTDTLEDVEFSLAMSPKGNRRFLRCPQNLGLTLIPEGVDFFKHEILKPELTAQREEREDSQQGKSSVRGKPRP